MGSVASLVAEAEQVGPNEEAMAYAVDLAGIDKGYATQAASTYILVQRAEGHETDASVWQAVGERRCRYRGQLVFAVLIQGRVSRRR